MGIVNCITAKLAAQKSTFTKDGKQVTYKNLVPADKEKVLKGGYLLEDKVNEIHSRIQAKIREGKTERQAAQETQDEMTSDNQLKIAKIAGTQDAIQRAISDVDAWRASGIADKKGASGLIENNSSRDIHNNATIASGTTYANAYKFARTQYASQLDAAVKMFPKSVFGNPNILEESKFVNALYGDKGDGRYDGAVKAVTDFVKNTHDDMIALNRPAYSNEDILKSPWTVGEKLRADEASWDAMMAPDRIKWDRALKDQPITLSRDEGKLQYLKDLKYKLSTDGVGKVNEFVHESMISFKDPNDLLAYQQKFGHGSMLGTLNHLEEHFSRQYALGKLTGGSPEAFRAGLLDYIAKTNPTAAGDFRRQYDSAMSVRMADRDSTANTWIRGAGKGLKNSIIESKLGFVLLSQYLHLGPGSVNASTKGLSGNKMLGMAFMNTMKRIFTPGEWAEVQTKLAQAGLNATRAQNSLEGVADDWNTGLIGRFFRQSANWVANSSLGFGSKIIKSSNSLIAQQDLSNFLRSGKSVSDANMKALGMVGLTDADANILRPYVYDNTDMGPKVPMLDLKAMYDTRDGATVDAAIKAHRILDDNNQALYPHGEDRWTAQLTKLRRAGSLGSGLADIAGTMTGYTAGALANTYLPVIRSGGISAIARTTQMLAMGQAMGMAGQQIWRLLHSQDVLAWNDPRLWTEGLFRGTAGAQTAEMTAGLQTAYHHNTSMADGLMAGMGPINDMRDVVGATKDYMTGSAKNQHDLVKKSAKVLGDVIPGQSYPIVGQAITLGLKNPLYRSIDPEGFDRSNQNKIKNEQKAGSDYYMDPGTGTMRHNPFIGK
jgi:hypothetical protein